MATTLEAKNEARVVKTSGLTRFLRKWALQIALTIVAILIWLFFLWRAPGTFKSFDIYNSLMLTTPFFALVAIPLTLVVIIKEIDLSFPSVMAWGVAAYELVYQPTHSVWLGFIACLLAGLIAGLLNGLIIVKLGIPSLIATIGTQYFWRGVVMITQNGKGSGMVEVKDTILYPLLTGKLFGTIPMEFIWVIIFGVVAWYFLNRHQFGAHIYLSGDNEDSARLMGVNVSRTKIITFCLVGLVATFTGFMVSESLLFFWPTMGDSYLLSSLASVFLGGTSVFGGTGTVYGTILGAFVIAIIQPGIVAAGWLAYWTELIYGFIIVISLALQAVLRRRFI
ncbi:MAG TPA: ABC transporter permease [Anaerolineales bacterium]|nr:ABC transporter permease [Anaerolineales bacterium]